VAVGSADALVLGPPAGVEAAAVAVAAVDGPGLPGDVPPHPPRSAIVTIVIRRRRVRDVLSDESTGCGPIGPRT
jgi:hypothetical protein